MASFLHPNSLHHGLGTPVACVLITDVAGIAMHAPVGVEVPEAALIAGILQPCPGHVPANGIIGTKSRLAAVPRLLLRSHRN